MTEEKLFEIVKNGIEVAMGYKMPNLSLTSSLGNQVYMEHQDILDLAEYLGENFGYHVMNDALEWKTVGDVVNYFKQKIG